MPANTLTRLERLWRLEPYLIHTIAVPLWIWKVFHDLGDEARWPQDWRLAWLAFAALLWAGTLALIVLLRRGEQIVPASIVPALTGFLAWASPPLLFLALHQLAAT